MPKVLNKLILNYSIGYIWIKKGYKDRNKEEKYEQSIIIGSK